MYGLGNKLCFFVNVFLSIYRPNVHAIVPLLLWQPSHIVDSANVCQRIGIFTDDCVNTKFASCMLIRSNGSNMVTPIITIRDWKTCSGKNCNQMSSSECCRVYHNITATWLIQYLTKFTKTISQNSQGLRYAYRRRHTYRGIKNFSTYPPALTNISLIISQTRLD